MMGRRAWLGGAETLNPTTRPYSSMGSPDPKPQVDVEVLKLGIPYFGPWIQDPSTSVRVHIRVPCFLNVSYQECTQKYVMVDYCRASQSVLQYRVQY